MSAVYGSEHEALEDIANRLIAHHIPEPHAREIARVVCTHSLRYSEANGPEQRAGIGYCYIRDDDLNLVERCVTLAVSCGPTAMLAAVSTVPTSLAVTTVWLVTKWIVELLFSVRRHAVVLSDREVVVLARLKGLGGEATTDEISASLVERFDRREVAETLKSLSDKSKSVALVEETAGLWIARA